MPIQAVESLRLYRQIADQLANLIESGEYGVGDRLPPERVLAEQLKVSRSSVREALIALEVEGCIEIRGGTGVFVLDRDARKRAREEGAVPGPFEVLEVRALLEPEAAALAARHATVEDIAKMEAAIESMRVDNAEELTAGLDGDREFHLAIAATAANGALSNLMRNLWEMRRDPLYVQLEQHFHTEMIWDAAIEEHGEIVAAIRAHDPRAARAAMTRHVKNQKNRFASTWTAREGTIPASKAIKPVRRRG